jgi:hypothetical protein
MPSKSAKQARMMAAAAHDPKFAKKVGVPVSVAEEFNEADTGTGIIRPKKKQKGANQFALPGRAGKSKR